MPLLEQIRWTGVTCILVHIPYCIAIFDTNAEEQQAQMVAAIKKFLGEADAMLMRRDPEPLIVRGMVNALCRCAMLSDRLQAEIMRLTGRYASSANPRLRELASEVASMVSAG